MKKQRLQERFQQLAGIKPLYENEANHIHFGIPSSDNYETLYITNTKQHEEINQFGGWENFEYTDSTSPQGIIFTYWNNELLHTYGFNSLDEFLDFLSTDINDEYMSWEDASKWMEAQYPEGGSRYGYVVLERGNVVVGKRHIMDLR